MNTPNETQDKRPGYWLRAIEFRKHQLGREYRATLGDTAREGISDEDYATTMATLEKMALNLGWSEDDRPEFGPRGRGFGPGFGRGRGHGHGPGEGHGHHPFRSGHGHPQHDHAEGTETASPTTTPEA